MSEETLKMGDTAPDFELPSDTGQIVKLSDFRGKRVVLYFYPRDDTSGCTTQACGFRDSYPQIEEKNAVVLGVSPDGVWGEKAFLGKKSMGIIRSHFVIDDQGKIADAQVKVSPTGSVEKAIAALR